jgi:SAM-dependent methyltransferase
MLKIAFQNSQMNDPLFSENLRKYAKLFLPDDLLKIYRVRKAEREHSATKHNSIGIPQELLEEARLVANRELLVERMPKNAVVCEIGVAEGNFSAEIIERSSPAKLYLVDKWESVAAQYSEAALRKVEERFRAEIESGKVILRRDYSLEALGKFEDNSFDWVYVDAAHDYASVKADLEACRRVVRPGGFICGHDYVRWASPISRLGVVEAVNEFIVRTGSRLAYLTNQHNKVDSYAIQLPV